MNIAIECVTTHRRRRVLNRESGIELGRPVPAIVLGETGGGFGLRGGASARNQALLLLSHHRKLFSVKNDSLGHHWVSGGCGRCSLLLLLCYRRHGRFICQRCGGIDIVIVLLLLWCRHHGGSFCHHYGSIDIVIATAVILVVIVMVLFHQCHVLIIIVILIVTLFVYHHCRVLNIVAIFFHILDHVIVVVILLPFLYPTPA
mmetsp:Transcript_36941/g.89075  ORF Transcript_36941/g.89075 Transcript_36941/m.89075 type:complete len:202 (+) Transcript_36941:1138-1743(+)